MATEENSPSGGQNQDGLNLARLRAVRGGNRAAVSRLHHEVEVLIQDQQGSRANLNVIARLESIANVMKLKQDCLTKLNDKILDVCDEADIAKEIEEATDYDAKLNKTVEKISLFKLENYASSHAETASYQGRVNLHSTPQTQRDRTGHARVENNEIREGHEGPSSPSPDDSTHSSLQGQGSGQGIRLPKISLPRFNGDLKRFSAFWQSFDCAINSNTSISGIQKLNYLLSLLDGPAYRALEGLDLTEQNYKHAVEILKTRFGNKQHIINEHMAALLKLQDYPNQKVSQIRYIFDNINVHVRGLETLGMPSENYGSLLIPIIMSRMPKEITTQVARKITQEVWPIDEILEIIKSEIEAKEFAERVTSTEKNQERKNNNFSKPTSPQATVQSFVANNSRKPPVCVFCKGEHLSVTCTTVTDIKERKSKILSGNLCFVSLRSGHLARDCYGNRRCKKCGGKHHQSICDKKINSEGESGETKTQETTVTSSAKSKDNVL